MTEPEYRSHLSMEAASFLITLSKEKQRKVLDLADRIAAQPFQISDYQLSDESGRLIENILIDEFLFSYWLDHADKRRSGLQKLSKSNGAQQRTRGNSGKRPHASVER